MGRKNISVQKGERVLFKDIKYFFYIANHTNYRAEQIVALSNERLQIPEKKVTAFIGPSGCGKSTLLRCFNRMYSLYPEQRAEGEVVLDGENLLTTKQDVSLIRAK